MAASATFALKAGVWFLRGRLLMVSPDSRAHLARRQAEIPLIVLFKIAEPALSDRRHGLVRAPDSRVAAVGHNGDRLLHRGFGGSAGELRPS